MNKNKTNKSIKTKNKIEIELKHELSKARRIVKNGAYIVRNAMLELAATKSFNSAPVFELIDAIYTSLNRNKFALIGMCRMKNPHEYMYTHSLSTCVLVVAMAIELELDEQKIQEIALGALLGDVGKLRVKKNILNKPGKLTEDEFEEVKKHASYTSSLLEESRVFSELSIQAAAEHHERWDGSGYPHGISGRKISIAGQITAIADVYDALTSPRCYMNAVEPTDILQKMMQWSDVQFNPELVKKFIKLMGKYPVGTYVALSNGSIAVVTEQNSESILMPTIRPIYDLKEKKMLQEENILHLADYSDKLKIIKHVNQAKLNFNPIVVFG